MRSLCSLELQGLVESKRLGGSFSICGVPLGFSKPEGTEARERNGSPSSCEQSWRGRRRRARPALINNSFSRWLPGRQQSKQLKLEAFQVVVGASSILQPLSQSHLTVWRMNDVLWVAILLQFPQNPSPWGLPIFLPTTSGPSSLSESHQGHFCMCFFFLSSYLSLHNTPLPLPLPQGASITCSLMNAFNQVYEVSLLSVTLIALNCCIISSAMLRCSS